jgi:hypothetical protein
MNLYIYWFKAHTEYTKQWTHSWFLSKQVNNTHGSCMESTNEYCK